MRMAVTKRPPRPNAHLLDAPGSCLTATGKLLRVAGNCLSATGKLPGDSGSCPGEPGNLPSDSGKSPGGAGSCLRDLGNLPSHLGSCLNDLGKVPSGWGKPPDGIGNLLEIRRLSAFKAQYTSTSTVACSTDFTTSSNLRSFVWASFSLAATSGTDSRKLRR